MILNTYQQLVQAVEDGIIPRNQAIAVSYIARSKWFEPRIQVWSPFFKTDPDAHWYNEGCMTFSINGLVNKKNKQDAMDTAKAWATEKYGITAWLPNRQHDWVPVIVEEIQPIPKEERVDTQPIRRRF